MEDRHLCKARPLGTRKQWVTGFYAVLGEKTVIIEKEPEKYYDVDSGENSNGNKIVEVIPKTVCQCTGYEGIYEKDIIRYEYEEYVIKWSDDLLRWEAISLETDVSVPLGELNPNYMVVIGNEIDNPELLEGVDMKENEAIKELETSINLAKRCTQNYERKREIQGYEMAIKALEEIQQYRAIGTVEECRAAMEKQTAKKPITYEGTNRADCPACGATIRGISKPFGDWCSHCGQRLDWSDEA